MPCALRARVRLRLPVRRRHRPRPRYLAANLTSKRETNTNTELSPEPEPLPGKRSGLSPLASNPASVHNPRPSYERLIFSPISNEHHSPRDHRHYLNCFCRSAYEAPRAPILRTRLHQAGHSWLLQFDAHVQSRRRLWSLDGASRRCS